MYADHIPKATSLLADVIAVLRPPGDEEESVGTTFCFLGGRMHVSGKAAAKDLDYSQGLNFILPSFLPSCPGNGSCPPSQPAPEVYKSAFLGQMALERRQGTPATAGTCNWELGSLSLYCCRAQTVVQCQFCTWSPGHLGEPALVLQNFTLWTHLPLTESKVSCAEDAFQARCSTFWQPPTR